MSGWALHPWALTWLAALAAYLIGSLSFAVIVSRVMGLHDPRTYGRRTPAPPMCCVRVTKKPQH